MGWSPHLGSDALHRAYRANRLRFRQRELGLCPEYMLPVYP